MNEIKVVLVEDHPLMRQGMRLTLAQQPQVRVLAEADNGAAALELVRQHKPDVVVMDVHLPGEDGIQTSKRILSEFPGVKIIILSADIELATIHGALQAGVSAYLLKEGPPEELVRALHEVLDQRLYLCSQVSSLVVGDYLQGLTDKPVVDKLVLSERERSLLKLVAEGKRNKEIAQTLGLGVKSIETYRSRLMRKVKCGSAAELTRYAIREGIAQA